MWHGCSTDNMGEGELDYLATQCKSMLKSFVVFFFLVFFLMKTVCRYKINSCPQYFMKKLKNIKKYNKTYIIKHMDTHNKA